MVFEVKRFRDSYVFFFFVDQSNIVDKVKEKSLMRISRENVSGGAKEGIHTSFISPFQ